MKIRKMQGRRKIIQLKKIRYRKRGQQNLKYKRRGGKKNLESKSWKGKKR